MKPLALVLVAAVAIAALVTCAREDGLPDPPLQSLVPCDPMAASDDPLACPPADAAIDAMPDAPPDAPPDVPPDATIDAVPDASIDAP